MLDTPSDAIVVTGIASTRVPRSVAFSGAVNPIPFLRTPKSRKYLSPQDDLAVVCAGRAIADAMLPKGPLGPNAALAMCVGFLSFDRKDTDPVIAVSTGDDQKFSMTKFAAEGMRKTHPLLTFRCLPNMPAYHVSVNFGIQGPYLATYPTVAQTYGCIEQAVRWLQTGRVSVALVGAVAHQNNFLVDHHLGRIAHPADLANVFDAGSVMVLERSADALLRGARIKAVLTDCARVYTPRDMLNDPGPVPSDSAVDEPLSLGCASVLVALAEKIHIKHNAAERTPVEIWTHTAVSIDGHSLRSEWEVRP